MSENYSLDSIRELIGDEIEMQRELLILFTTSVVETVDMVKKSTSPDEIKKAVHKIKPSVQLMGSNVGYQLALDLESAIVERKAIDSVKLAKFLDIISEMREEILIDYPDLT